jgi:hypothetical protein
MANRIHLPRRIVKALSTRLKVAIDSVLKNRDPIKNPQLLEKLSSYASITTRKTVICNWGSFHGTDLENTITLNPNDPEGAKPAERKIVIDSALEHEISGHWKYTPRNTFEIVKNLSSGDQNPEFPISHLSNYLEALLPLFNILEDGRIETRLRWEEREIYKIIAMGDLIRPRWNPPEIYLTVQKAYNLYLIENDSNIKSVCLICRENQTVSKTICLQCFTSQYRWEQISGLLLISALPPHTPPIDIVENEVKGVFDICIQWVTYAIKGTSLDVIKSSIKILEILIKHNMVPPQPNTAHLKVSDAKGQRNANDSKMKNQTEKASGLINSSINNIDDEQKGKNINPTKEKQSKSSEGSNHKEVSNQESKSGNNRDTKKDSGNNNIASNMSEENVKGNGANPNSENNSQSQKDFITIKPPSIEEGKPSHDLAHSKNKSFLDSLAGNSLSDYNFQFELNIQSAIEQAEGTITSLIENVEEDLARELIAKVSGVGAGPGSDIKIERTDQLRELYRVLERRNREAGRRFARQIKDLMTIVSRPQRYKKVGRLDRRRLISAVARGKDTVFISSKEFHELDLAVSINVDISGSMDTYNQRIQTSNTIEDLPAQLVDAVTIFSIGFGLLEIPFEIRAFGSKQWLSKAFHEKHCYGIAGLAGEDNGGTAMIPAIEYSKIALCGRMEKKQLMIIMTDGYPYDSENAAKQVQEAKQLGINVVGILFDNNPKIRDEINPYMAKLFSPNGFTVIHSLDDFPREIGRAVKGIIYNQAIPL